jgi:DNA-binding MurR/RpiR family transcriptional regulator
MILDTIRSVYPELTRSQQRLADFVAHEYREAAFMTASDMALRLHLNEATVIRFAQRLGYSGYPDLVAAIRELVQHEFVAGHGGGESDANPVLSLLLAELDNAQRLARSISGSHLLGIVDLLARAESIYVLGQGQSHPYALLLCDALRAVDRPALHASIDPHSLAAALCDVGPESVVVGISADGERSGLVAAALRLARQRSAGTIAMACDPLSPCAQAAEYALICPQSGQLLLPSITSLAAMIDVLAQTLGARDLERVQDRRHLVNRTRDWIVSSVAEQ